MIIGKFRAEDKKLFRLEETDVTEHDISSANALCILNTPYIPWLTEAHWSDTSSLSETDIWTEKKCTITTSVNAKGNLTSFSKETSVLGWYPSNMQSLERKQWSVMEVRTWTLSICHRLRARKILSCLHIHANILACAPDIFLNLIIVSDLKSEIFQLVAVITDIAVFKIISKVNWGKWFHGKRVSIVTTNGNVCSYGTGDAKKETTLRHKLLRFKLFLCYSLTEREC